MDAKKLRRAYSEYNRKYFDNQLPPVSEVQLRWERMQIMGYCTANEIVINRKDRDRVAVWRLTLLHEMCHLLLQEQECVSHEKNHHGRRWQQEMLKLAEKGAFNTLW